MDNDKKLVQELLVLLSLDGIMTAIATEPINHISEFMVVHINNIALKRFASLERMNTWVLISILIYLFMNSLFQNRLISDRKYVWDKRIIILKINHLTPTGLSTMNCENHFIAQIL